jgi:autotransporter passenger strand-loop-strand repeat protein
VGVGGTVTAITALAGGSLNVDGGTADNIVLAGGSENLSSGTTNNITFEDPQTNGSIDVLTLSDPASLQGTITFDSPPGVPDSYHVVIGFGETITSFHDTGHSLVLTYGHNQSVTYPYTLNFDESLNFEPFLPNGHEIGITVQSEGPPLGTPAFSPETAGTIVYTAEFGTAPSASELTILNQFTQAQFAYGQQIGVTDPTVYAYEALGMALASTATHFQNTFGPTVDGDVQFLVDAYASVFGQPGSGAQIQQFSDQLNFLEGLYTAAGVFGSASNIDLLARGAVYGQMLGVEHESTLIGSPPGGTTFTAPPDQNNLVLNNGDVLNVNNHGTASNTVINAGGVENVMGQSILTAITNSGVENVEPGGVEDGPVFIGGGGVLKLSDPHQLGGKIQLGPEAAVIDFVNTQVTEVGGLTKLSQILYEVHLTYGDHQTSGVIIQSDFNILVALQADGHGGTELTIQTNQSSTDVIGIQHQLEHPAV